jgi:hypothetical protein
MSNIAAINTTNEIDQYIWSALKNSLYTGARDVRWRNLSRLKIRNYEI